MDPCGTPVDILELMVVMALFSLIVKKQIIFDPLKNFIYTM